MSPSSFTSKPYRKYLLIFLLLISCACATPATAQSWLWARTASSSVGSQDGNGAFAASADAFGNIYVTGYFFEGLLTFDTCTIHTYGSDMFLVKYDSSGNALWARNAKDSIGVDYGNAIATDASGNTYVTGNFSYSPITFDSVLLATTDRDNLFLVKYNLSGNVLWAKSACGTISGAMGNNWAASTITDNAGNVYMTGYFCSPTLTIGTTTLNNIDGVDANMFVIKFDSSGDIIWSKSLGISGGNVFANSVTTDEKDNVYISGNFYGGSITFGATTLTSGSIFLVKYNSDGNAIWAKSAGTNGAGISSITTDPWCNILATGSYTSSNITFGTYTLSNPGMFLVNYDSSGNVLWAQSAGAGRGNSVTADAVGSIYVLGDFGTDSITFGNKTLYIVNGDMFLVKYDPSGSVEWAESANRGNCGAESVTNDVIGNIYVSGYYFDSLKFSTTTLINEDIPITSNSSAMFLAKLSSTLGTPIINPNQQNIVLYPNPNNGQITVVFPVAGYDNIVVYDCLGRQVYTTTLAGNKQTVAIDLRYVPPGVYYLKATGEGKSENVPFVVKNNS